MVYLEQIEVNDCFFNNLNIKGCLGLKIISLARTELFHERQIVPKVEYNISDLQNLEELYQHITYIDYTQLLNLKKLHTKSTSSMDFTNFSSLEELYISMGNSTYGIDDDFLPILKNLQLPAVKTNLKKATIDVALLITLNLDDFVNLEYLKFYVGRNTSNPGLQYASLLYLSLNNCNSLKTLDISETRIENFNSNLPSLENFSCTKSKIKELNLNNSPNLISLDCSNSDLKALKIANTSIESQLNFLPNSELNFICADAAQIGTIQNQINLANLNNQITVNSNCNLSENYITIAIPDVNFKNKLIELGVDANADNTIQLSEALAQTNLNISNANITDLTGIAYFTNLTSLNCSSNAINYLNVTKLSALKNFDFSNNNCVFVDLSKLVNLETINASNNQLRHIYFNNNKTESSFDFSGNPKLHTIITDSDQNSYFAGLYPEVQITNTGVFIDDYLLYNFIYLSEALNTLSISRIVEFSPDVFGTTFVSGERRIDLYGLENFKNLESFSFNGIGGNGMLYGNISENIVNSMLYLEDLEIISGGLLIRDFRHLKNLKRLKLAADLDGSNSNNYINLNENKKLEILDLANTIGSYEGFKLFIKNGANEVLNLESFNYGVIASPNYICADDFQVEQLKNLETFSNQYPYDAIKLGDIASINTYCSFLPGSNYNTISGIATYDDENNGCDSNDVSFDFLRLELKKDTEVSISSTFTGWNGNYSFYPNAGNFTLTPKLENPTYFSVSPTSVPIQFLDANNNLASNNFCITPNGVHNDLEVVLAPLTPARPGFDAEYSLVFKNKGNQPLSGTVSVAFEDDKLDFVEASTLPTLITTNLLSWDFTNLLPFENRSITITLNTNSPMETPAVNNDDILNFSAAITPLAGDEIAEDNNFILHQTVVGSFDPNDIYCLEGNVVDPSKIGKYLHYNVRFENTGTFEAENIVIATTINPADYDLNSLQVLNASHDVYTRIKDNKVEFVFKKIKLKGKPAGGHGGVVFKMKSQSNLQTNDNVTSNANIFFDYNFPIGTNDATTVFTTLSRQDFTKDSSVKIYPNPAQDKVTIGGNNALKSITIYDAQGGIVQYVKANALEKTIDLTQLSKGIYILDIVSEQGRKVEKLVKD